MDSTFNSAIKQLLLLGILGTFCHAQDKPAPAKIRKAKLGTTERVRAIGQNLFASQPSKEDFAIAKKMGIKTVINLRFANELDWDESKTVKELGLEWHNIGFKKPDTLTDDVFKSILSLLKDKKHQPYLLHCSSSNRVGAVWLAHRVLNDGLSTEVALKEAKEIGLSKPPHEQKALAYIQKNKGEQSVRPGMNKNFTDPEMDVSEWIARFEIESREVYLARERILDVLDIKPGMTVADIGAGTGFYSRLFASAAGENGWVYSVDISSRFLEHINKQSQDDKVHNISSVLCTDRSVRLPPNSVDVAFICDTYHHFEFPKSTLASIHRALKPGGRLVVIDFDRIPGESREFILGHVRAGKEVFQKEITAAGLRFVDEIKIPQFKENYLLRFKKD